jgi:two-component system, OmpR family, response regulator
MPQATILLIEDQEGIRDSLAAMLRLQGYDVLTAATEAEAEAVRQRVGLGGLALVITNIRLTRAPQAREGYALLQRWHPLAPRLPFLLISGESAYQDLPAVRAGAVRLLVKPFPLEAFLAAVREVLGR